MLTACSSDGKQKYGNLSKDEAKTEVATYYKKIDPIKAKLKKDISSVSLDTASELPDIDKAYPYTVEGDGNVHELVPEMDELPETELRDRHLLSNIQVTAVNVTVTRPCEIMLTNERLQDIYNDLSVSFEFASLADIDPTSQTNNVKVALTNWLESCVRPYE